MKTIFFTKQPFTVEYNSKSYSIDRRDIVKILIATVVSLPFFLIGAVFAFLGTSYYFRSKKIQQLRAQDSSDLQRIDLLRNENLPSTSSILEGTLPQVSLNQVEDVFSSTSTHPINSAKEEARAKLNLLCKEYAELHASPRSNPDLYQGLIKLKLDLERNHHSLSVITPDNGLANLLLSFREDSKSFFIPHTHYLDANIEKSDQPNTEKGIAFLKENLSAALVSGKEFVVVRIGGNNHTIVAAFRSNGEFRIVDSICDNTIDLSQLAQALNQAQIQNAVGQTVVFKGEYINTHLQKGGHECMRFATLYGYQMAKKQSFDGYKEVNGAFAEGRLQSFEDINNINGAALIEDGSKISTENYRNFMHSWAYRTVGIKVDDWKEITLAEFNSDKKRNKILLLSSDKFIESRSVPLDRPLTLEDGSFPPSISLPSDWGQIRLKSLIPEGPEKVVIIIRANEKPLIFRLSADQKMPRINVK